MVSERVDAGLDDLEDAGLSALPDTSEDASDTAVERSGTDADDAAAAPAARDEEIRRAANRMVRERERQFERDFRKAVETGDETAIRALKKDNRWSKVWSSHERAVQAARPSPAGNTVEAQAMQVLDDLDRLRESNPAAYFQYLDEHRQQVEHWTNVRATRRQAEQRARADLERTRPAGTNPLEATYDRLMSRQSAAVLTDADRDELEQFIDGEGDVADLTDRFVEMVTARQAGRAPRRAPLAERAREAARTAAPVGGAPGRASGSNPRDVYRRHRDAGTLTPEIKEAYWKWRSPQRGP